MEKLKKLDIYVKSAEQGEATFKITLTCSLQIYYKKLK